MLLWKKNQISQVKKYALLANVLGTSAGAAE